MKWLVLILLMARLVCAVDVDFDCPDDIFVDDEFECSLEVFDTDGTYDVKIDLDGERDSVLKIWNGDEWISGYYYLKKFVDEDGDYDVKLKVSEEDDWDGVLKLRKGEKIEFFDIEIEVEERKKKDNDREPENISKENTANTNTKKENKVIALGAVDKNETEEAVVYSSRNAIALDYSIYVFCGILIFIIGVLLWERF